MRAVCSVALLTVLACCSTRSAAPAVTDGGLPTGLVTVVTSSATRLPVRVEIATDDASRQQGLMYRRLLAADAGMLFVFSKPSQHSFWMKNTLIPLDMLFIQADGTIAGIVADATPQTTDPRGVPAPTQYVLEVNGGWSVQNGVKAGDRVLLGDLPPAQ